MLRREFLKSVSALAVFAASPALAGLRLHGGSGTVSAFNGGKSQGQATDPNDSGDFPFVNLMKNLTDFWQALGDGTLPGGQGIPPDWLTPTGYPDATKTGTNSFIIPMRLPLSTSKIANASNPFVTTWEGNIALSYPAFTNHVSNVLTFNSGTGLYTGRMVWYPSYQTDPRNGPINSASGLTFVVSPVGTAGGIATGSYLDKLTLCFADYESTLLAGDYFNPQFTSQIRTGNFGVWRFMDWLFTNTSQVTTWATRRTLNWISWTNFEYRASLHGGVTTNSGNDYSLTTLGTYVWTNSIQGNYTGGAPVDKQTMHLGFNVNATLVQNSENHGNLTVTGFGPLTFNWPTCPLSNGDPVAVAIFPGTGGNFIAGIGTGTTYYVVGKSGDNFNIALTAGGSAISSASTSTSGNVCITRTPTLNINGSGAIPIRWLAGNPIDQSNLLPAGSSSFHQWATMVFDAGLNCWMMAGGSTSQGNQGINNQIPPEVCFQLCKECGMHPFFSIPFGTLDPMTDYVPSLAAYCIANNPSWMIPRYECGNEVWNQLTPITQYFQNKGFQNFFNNPAGNGSISSLYAEYGKCLSTMGQAVAAAYGGTSGNLGSKYIVFASTQYPALIPSSTVSFDLVNSRVNWPAVPSATVTFNIAASSVGWTAHGFNQNQPVSFTTTGALPTGLTASTLYYVRTVIDANDFTLAVAPNGGAAITMSGTQSGTQTGNATHNLGTGEVVSFTTTGTLPTPLVARAEYLVGTVTNSTYITLNDIITGSAITLSGTPSGAQTGYNVQVQERIMSTHYVAQSASPQSGYLKVAALGYVSTILTADYIGPSLRANNQELQLAWTYFFTNAGNPTAQMATLNTYIDTMPSAGDPLVPGSGTSYYLGASQWAALNGISEFHGYEGGYSPDLVSIAPLVTSVQWQSTISAASKASSCVVTLPVTTPAPGSGNASGSSVPAVVGMVIGFSGVTSMTQLNTQLTSTASFTSGSSIISATNSLIAGQGVVFNLGNGTQFPVPPGISDLTPYYVLAAGLSSSQFQISTTPTGSPIVADPTNIYVGSWTNIAFDSGWFVTAVGVGGVNNVTLQVDSTGFTAFSGSAGTAYYLGSTGVVNNFRVAGLMLATDMPAKTIVNYQNFASVGGKFPSQYEFAGSGTIWPVIQPDIWGTQSQEFAGIVISNH